jgi:hypothetical protein
MSDTGFGEPQVYIIKPRSIWDFVTILASFKMATNTKKYFFKWIKLTDKKYKSVYSFLQWKIWLWNTQQVTFKKIRCVKFSLK